MAKSNVVTNAVVEPAAEVGADNAAKTNTLLVFGDVKIDSARLPLNVKVWLMQRTLAHIMGNEANAALKAVIAKGDVADQDAFLLAWRAKKEATLLSGEIGLRATGPRAKGLERYMMEVAREQVEAKIKALPTEKRKAFTAAIITERVAEYRAKAEAAIKPEAERRMAYDQGSNGDTDLDSILGL